MKIDKETGLRGCPFCKGYDMIVNWSDEFFVECLICGARGPKRDEEEDAVATWNMRYDPEVDDETN